MASIEPATILEIGTFAGGSAWAFAQIPTVDHIVTVDLEPRPSASKRLASLNCMVSQVKGDSTRATTRSDILGELGDRKADVVLVDGGHDYRTARADFEFAGTVVHAGGLIVMHDTQGYPGNNTVQVPQVWAEIAAVYRTTELVDQPGGPGGTGLVWL